MTCLPCFNQPTMGSVYSSKAAGLPQTLFAHLAWLLHAARATAACIVPAGELHRLVHPPEHTAG
jgi:hypothetical protein